MRKNAALAKWRAGQQTIGGWLSLSNTHSAEALSRIGFDWLCVDMQHGLLDYGDLRHMLPAISGSDTTPIVRVSGNDPREIMKALDAGAYGVIVPLVNTREEAAAAISACRYPPLGRRGAAFGFAQCDYQGGDIGQKIRNYHDRTLVVAQIETERGLAEVEEIAAVDGIDVLWVGHFDLSNFMGIPAQFDNPTFLQAMQRVADVAKQHGKAAGFMATDPAWVDRVKAMGYTMLAVGTDVSLLAEATKRLVDHAAASPAGPR